MGASYVGRPGIAGRSQRLNPVTQAGQFGNEGRNIVRGPAIENVDLSLLKNISLTERTRLQFGAEFFNIANHPNFGLPDNDLASPNLGCVLEAGPPRLVPVRSQTAVLADLAYG